MTPDWVDVRIPAEVDSGELLGLLGMRIQLMVVFQADLAHDAKHGTVELIPGIEVVVEAVGRNSHAVGVVEDQAVIDHGVVVATDCVEPIVNAFAKGHRIRVEISSSYFPYYLRNLNTGDDNTGLATQPVVAQQTIHHSTDRASHIVLPVIPNGPRP